MKSYENLGEAVVALMYLPKMVVYEFGTMEGNTLRVLNWFCNTNRVPIEEAYSFDSFRGLCKEEEGIPKLDGWDEGTFSLVEYYKELSFEKIMEGLYKTINIENLKIIPGFYSDTLIPELADTLKIGDLIHIDCDLYISAKQALEFLFKYKLVKSGTIICYDEYFSISGGGEERAHKEMVDKYKVRCREIFSDEEKPSGIIRKNFLIERI